MLELQRLREAVLPTLRQVPGFVAAGDWLGSWDRLSDEGVPPAIRKHNRKLDARYEGPIFVWDIDKTYLQSDFDSFFKIARLGLQSAREKRNVPGVATLLRRLKRGPTGGDAMLPLYFLTAGPPQIDRVFREKLALDGVECDGVTYKDWASLVLTARFSRIWNHIPYKLAALLRNRIDFPHRSHEILFGDDAEQDALIYTLYEEVVSHRLRGRELVARLTAEGLDEREIDCIASLQDLLPPHDPVFAIHIHVAAGTDCNVLERLSPRLRATHNSFECAVWLFTEGYLDLNAVIAVARDLREHWQFTRLDFARSLVWLWRRGILGDEALDEHLAELRAADVLPADLQRHGDALVCSVGSEIVSIEPVVASASGRKGSS